MTTQSLRNASVSKSARGGGPTHIARVFWRFVFGYDGEVCRRCHLPVAWATPTWWHADDHLWNEVEGAPNGIRCARCFTLDARALGITVSWEPSVEYRA